MTEQALELHFQNILQEFLPRKHHLIKVQFYTSKNLRHTIEIKRKIIFIRLSKLIQEAPVRVLDALGQILIFKLFRYKPNPTLRKIYNTYIEDHIIPDLPKTRHRISKNYSAIGTHFNLSEIFDRLNQVHFQNKLSKPKLGWSLKPAYTRLGFWDVTRNLLVISQIFDSPKADPQALDYLMYHEMLHILIPAEVVNGRRRIHPAEFKRLERAFPEYERIQKWIRKKRLRL